MIFDREGLGCRDGPGSMEAASRRGRGFPPHTHTLHTRDLADLGDLALEKLVECGRRMGGGVGQELRGRGEDGGSSGSAEERCFEEMRCVLEDMCGAIHELARERDEMEQLAVVWESQVRELRDSQEAQACTSKREEKRRHNVERQLEAAKEALSLCQAELDSVQEELHNAHALLRLQPIPEEHAEEHDTYKGTYKGPYAEMRGERRAEERVAKEDDSGSVPISYLKELRAIEVKATAAEATASRQILELTKSNGLLVRCNAELEATNREVRQLPCMN